MDVQKWTRTSRRRLRRRSAPAPAARAPTCWCGVRRRPTWSTWTTCARRRPIARAARRRPPRSAATPVSASSTSSAAWRSDRSATRPIRDSSIGRRVKRFLFVRKWTKSSEFSCLERLFESNWEIILCLVYWVLQLLIWWRLSEGRKRVLRHSIL